MPILTIIIVNWNTCGLLRNCLQSLHDDGALDAEIIVVDNNSTDNSVAMLRQEFPKVRIIANQNNAGFAQANNQGINSSSSNYLLLLNSDTVVPPGTISKLLDFMGNAPQTGAISPRLVRLDSTPQPFAYGNDPTPGYLLRRAFTALLFKKSIHNWAIDNPIEVDWVSGACMLVRRKAIDQAGMLDEQMFMYFEDNEWCLRMRKMGWKIVYYPEVSITHIGGQSLKQNSKAQSAYYASLHYFYRKHYGRLANLWLTLFLPIYARIR